jgi:hypothetical protein
MRFFHPRKEARMSSLALIISVRNNKYLAAKFVTPVDARAIGTRSMCHGGARDPWLDWDSRGRRALRSGRNEPAQIGLLSLLLDRTCARAVIIDPGRQAGVGKNGRCIRRRLRFCEVCRGFVGSRRVVQGQEFCSILLEISWKAEMNTHEQVLGAIHMPPMARARRKASTPTP